MNNFLNNCKIVNIVWIDRGIILSIIYFILKYYDELVDKIIIITEDMYRIYIKSLFPKLKIEDYKKHKSNNFYFNIKKIIRNQDIIIDFVKNYKYSINTSKIYLVPWFNMYDPLIAYRLDKKEKIKIDKYILFINNFSKCSRGNYLNNIWDVYMENKIMMKYNKFNPKNSIINQINLFNQFIIKNYQYLTYSSIQYPKVFYRNIIPVINSFHSSIPNNSVNSIGNTLTSVAPATVTPATVTPAAVTPAAVAPAAHAAIAPAAHAAIARAAVAPSAYSNHLEQDINLLENQIRDIEINNQQKMDNLIEILNNKIKLINNLI